MASFIRNFESYHADHIKEMKLIYLHILFIKLIFFILPEKMCEMNLDKKNK